ncbi:hypothetical protein B0H13DRAFT_617467 [Mycena leptocephala]|nr:hypothetical protein B0H13DRAFT_617467 [Mycena leptocephala]
MRLSLSVLSALAVSHIASAAFVHVGEPARSLDTVVLGQREPEVPVTTGTDLILRSELPVSNSTDLVELEKRLFGLEWLTLGALIKGVRIAWGLYKLVDNIFSIPKQCDGQNQWDCLIQVGNTVVSYFTLGYQVYDAAAQSSRALDGVPTYGIASFADGSFVHAHIPLPSGNGTALRHGVIAAHKNNFQNVKTGQHSEWLHIATRHAPDGTAVHKMFHRLASTADLGRNNTMSAQHIRVQAADVPHPNDTTIRGNSKRADDSATSYGLVGEYLWQENDKSLWDDLHTACEGSFEGECTMGGYLASDLESRTAMASCAVPGVAKGSGSYSGVDHGVFAYGWNNKPFEFKGRLGGWLDNCGAPPRSCKPISECTDTPHPVCTIRQCDCSDGFTVTYSGGKCQA